MNPRPRILVVEALATWHDAIDAVFVECLARHGDVTLVVPEGYLPLVRVSRRVELPAALVHQASRLSARISGLRVLHRIRSETPFDTFDHIVFLAYETMSFALYGPKGRNVFLFEHNNIDNAQGSRLKTFFYRLLGRKLAHLVFMEYIGEHIRRRYGARTFQVSHPVFPVERVEAPPAPRTGPKIILSPSGSTPPEVQQALMDFASRSGGSFHAVCKGAAGGRGDAWETEVYFLDLERRIRECDMVFLGARFDFRISAFAYEAIGHGKPFVALGSPFTRALQREYPRLVFVVDELDEIARLELWPPGAEEERKRFLRRHSAEVICEELARALRGGEEGSRTHGDS